MKNLKSLLLLPALLVMQISVAQTNAHLKLSNPYPEKGEKVTFTYDPAGTPLASQSKLEGTAWCIETGSYPSTPVTMQADGKLFKGEFTVSANARAFFIKINSGKTIDDNAGKGYISLVYKDQKPVEGAYASNAFILSSGIGNAYAKIARNTDEASALYKKEFELYPQSEKQYGQAYYFALSQNPANAPVINKKVAELKASNEENDLIFASSLLRNSGNTAGADSLTKSIKARFPDGMMALSDAMRVILTEKSLVKKDWLFKNFLSKHPAAPANVKDNLIGNMLGVYLKNGDMASYDKYAAQITNKEVLVSVLNSAAWSMATSGEKLAEAEKLSKQSVDLILSNAGVISPVDLTKEKAGLFSMCGDTYAYILWKEGKFDEAEKYQTMVFNHAGYDNAEIIEHYVQILNAVKQPAKALEIAEKSIRDGKTSDGIEQELKKAYPLVKGSMTGFDKYWADVQKNNIAKKEEEKKALEAEQKALLGNANSAEAKQQLAKIKKELSSKMIKEPAPVFTLKDLDGNTVSLADLKGKTVIIDFWATWCGPCKMSFPGMQIAQNKYKSDPNIVFLFIDTWETGSNYLPGVKKFIADNSYSFHVLMDEPGADKKQSKVISTYKVDGIPTKFIIDKNGDIRFKYVGYSGTTEAVVNEVTAMIELLNEPVGKIAAPGTGAGSAPVAPAIIMNK